MTRYTIPARSKGKLYTQRRQARLTEKDAHRWLTTRLDNFYCDLQVMYLPHVIGPTLARTHIVVNNTPPLHAIARTDEAVEVDATGLVPHLSVYGWPFCLDDVDDMEGGAA